MCKNVKGLVSSCLWLTFLALMACSGSKGGVRLNAEKINIEREKNDNRPLYIVNGHILPFNESLDTLLQVKHKYLKDVQIIDAEKSASRYGKAGKYGAVEITLTDSTAAYNDLMDPNSSTNIMKLNPFKQALGTRKPTLIGGLANLQRKLKYPENCRDAGAEG
ncbi:MAG TPA: hypothetical protein VK112_10245 [Fodinibius sp.]|nr:hypothetical protein [Fodinibius sp.]